MVPLRKLRMKYPGAMSGLLRVFDGISSAPAHATFLPQALSKALAGAGFFGKRLQHAPPHLLKAFEQAAGWLRISPTRPPEKEPETKTKGNLAEGCHIGQKALLRALQMISRNSATLSTWSRMMKSILWTLGICLLQFAVGTVCLGASERPVRLAVVAESPEVSSVADLLVAELSKRPNLQLLERAEISRIYREQNLSAANQDYLKLGEVLGADGLLCLAVNPEGTNTLLQAQLVAVKPGVVIGSAHVFWPLKEGLQWAVLTARRFEPLYPKLGVLAQEALPLSVVALRAATKSKPEQELEQQLTFLLNARLVQEREVFVLERRRMGQLAQEKGLKGLSDSAFWNGSYLLEGIIDRDGYSEEQATIYARLSPPQGPPMEVRVVGKRSAPRFLIEQLAREILSTLHRKPTVAAWSPREEAAKYLEESTWQLQWAMVKEAQAAADAAWALGNRSFECALARVKAQLAAALPDTGGYTAGESHNKTGDEAYTERLIPRPCPDGLLYRRDSNVVYYVRVGKLPQPGEIDLARRVLELYTELGRALPEQDLQLDSVWYPLGLDALRVASQVLQHYNTAPGAQKAVENELAELRAQARQTAAWIAEVQKRAQSLLAAQGTTVSDPRADPATNAVGLLFCNADWGCFWQDKPEAAVALYRELFHSWIGPHCRANLSRRELNRPCLVAWNDEDRRRVPALTASLLEEGSHVSPLERMLFGPREPRSPGSWPRSRDFLAEHPALLLELQRQYLRTNALFGSNSVRRPRPPTPGLFVGQRLSSETLALQKQYLRTNTAFERETFRKLFLEAPYGGKEALEPQPVLAGYTSNMLSHSSPAEEKDNPCKRAFLEAANNVLRARLIATGGSTNTSRSNLNSSASSPGPAPRQVPSESNTNSLLVNRFLGLPEVPFSKGRERERFEGWVVVGHGVNTGQPWLDVRYARTYLYYTDTGSGWATTNCAALALLDPETGSWKTIEFATASRLPEMREFATVVHDALYVSESNTLKRYDFKTHAWQRLPVPWDVPARLLVVKDRLLAANPQGIFEIQDEGRDVKTLASLRRRPAVSALDELQSLSPFVPFPGPGQSLRALIGDAIYSWEGREWKKLLPAPLVRRCDVWGGVAVFRPLLKEGSRGLWWLPEGRERAECCLEEVHWYSLPTPTSLPGHSPAPTSTPLWKLSKDISPLDCVGTGYKGNLLLFAEVPRLAKDLSGAAMSGPVSYKVTERERCQAKLLWLERGRSKALIVPLKFDLSRGDYFSCMEGWMAFSAQWDPTWLSVTPRFVFVGQKELRGLWAIPVTELDDAIARAKVPEP